MSESRPLFSKRSLEGEYTAYNHVWNQDFGGGVLLSQVYADNYGNVYFYEQAASVGYASDYAGVNRAYPNSRWWRFLFNMACVAYSVTGKYQLAQEVATARIVRVYRYGEFLDDFDPAVPVPALTTTPEAAISPNGRYIAIIGWDGATMNNRYVLLYEGV